MANEQPPYPNISSDSGGPTEVSKLVSKHQLSANRRMEIDANLTLKLHLKEWVEQLKEDLLKIETYRNRCIAAKAELYQHMSFYILFQGVVLGAVSNGSKLTCQTSLFPASFSFLTSVATAFSVHSKLGYYEIEKLKFIKAEGLAQNLVNKINKLRNAGNEFKFGDINDSLTSSQKKLDDEASTQKMVLLESNVFPSCLLLDNLGLLYLRPVFRYKKTKSKIVCSTQMSGV